MPNAAPQEVELLCHLHFETAEAPVTTDPGSSTLLTIEIQYVLSATLGRSKDKSYDAVKLYPRLAR